MAVSGNSKVYYILLKSGVNILKGLIPFSYSMSLDIMHHGAPMLVDNLPSRMINAVFDDRMYFP